MMMSKNPSNGSYRLKPQAQNNPHNNSLFSKNEYSIDTNSQDLLNDSSVYIYDDPIIRSNQ